MTDSVKHTPHNDPVFPDDVYEPKSPLERMMTERDYWKSVAKEFEQQIESFRNQIEAIRKIQDDE